MRLNELSEKRSGNMLEVILRRVAYRHTNHASQEAKNTNKGIALA